MCVRPAGDAMNLTLEQYEKLIPRCELDHAGARMIFSTPNTGTRWRVETIPTEPKAVAGARETLKNPAVRSLLIEVNLNLADHRAMVAALNDLGFRHDPAQVERATRKDGEFKGVAEHVFKR
jgi:hypothetical protein